MGVEWYASPRSANLTTRQAVRKLMEEGANPSAAGNRWINRTINVLRLVNPKLRVTERRLMLRQNRHAGRKRYMSWVVLDDGKGSWVLTVFPCSVTFRWAKGRFISEREPNIGEVDGSFMRLWKYVQALHRAERHGILMYFPDDGQVWDMRMRPATAQAHYW